MRFEDVSLREVQAVWEANQRYSVASRSPELMAFVNVIGDMKVGDCKAVRVPEERDPASLRARIHQSAKIAGKYMRVVIDRENDRVLFEAVATPIHRGRRATADV